MAFAPTARRCLRVHLNRVLVRGIATGEKAWMAGGPGLESRAADHSETALSRSTYTVLRAMVKPRLTVVVVRVLAQNGEHAR